MFVPSASEFSALCSTTLSFHITFVGAVSSSENQKMMKKNSTATAACVF